MYSTRGNIYIMVAFLEKKWPTNREKNKASDSTEIRWATFAALIKDRKRNSTYQTIFVGGNGIEPMAS